ncbi:cysteine synthase A [Patescibacteria group bacterium]|nr:cysteine synthase A [Patescibacteria group bacterium]
MNKNILDAIGNTPLVLIGHTGDREARVLAKLEFLNPGSIKDRMALFMVEKAERKGVLRPGSTIIEATSGNTGTALAMIATVKGYTMVAVLSEGDVSWENRAILQAFGAKIILTPKKEGPAGAIRKRDQLAKKIPNVWIPDQFGNQDNVLAQQKTIGQEIITQTKGRIDAFVAGIGTGGTLMGVGKALKKMNPKIKIIAVEPAESAVLSGGQAGEHGIKGIGEGFLPALVDVTMIDTVIKVRTRQAIQMSRQLARNEGLLVGISSGANMFAALKVAKVLGSGKKVVTVLPDRGEHYFSRGLFQ